MGISFTAVCKCRYRVEVPTTSSRSRHGKDWWWPHACDACGSVVSINLLSDAHGCPNCGSGKVASYEEPRPPAVKLTFWQKLKGYRPPKPENLRDPLYSGYCGVQKKDFVIKRGKHHCPKCGETELQFYFADFSD